MSFAASICFTSVLGSVCTVKSTIGVVMLSKNSFTIGDIVKLKSGGPDMTVRTTPTPPGDYYVCQWFAGKKLESGSFPGDSIEGVRAQK